MTNIPKPKHCDQNWLEMPKTQGGRTCGQCEKTIVDFSRMKWDEIEKIQRLNNNGVCGMYNPKQLDNWGRKIPSYNDSLLKAAAITGLTVSCATSSFAQTTSMADSVVIQGTIFEAYTTNKLPFVNVQLIHNKITTTTDIDGNYKLVVKNTPGTPMPDTLEIGLVGYDTRKFIFADIKKLEEPGIHLKDGMFDIALESDADRVIIYAVTTPATLSYWIKWRLWKLKKWFGWKK